MSDADLNMCGIKSRWRCSLSVLEHGHVCGSVMFACLWHVHV